ncbi:MAG: spore coat U domain-containing protein [Gammaproteobacteria bacterium]
MKTFGLKSTLIFLSTTAFFSMSPAIYAASASGNLNVSATVAANCRFPSANTLAFGNYDPTAASDTLVTGTMSVRCSKNSTVTSIAVDNGANPSGTQRRMTGAGATPDFLNYTIFQPNGAMFGASPNAGTCPGSTAWGTGTAALTFDATTGNFASTTTSIINICGVIPQSQDIQPDTYSDVVMLTLEFN